MMRTMELRFVKRVVNPDTIHSRTAMILQQKWIGTRSMGDCNGCGQPVLTTTEEWRDVEVSDATE